MEEARDKEEEGAGRPKWVDPLRSGDIFRRSWASPLPVRARKAASHGVKAAGVSGGTVGGEGAGVSSPAEAVQNVKQQKDIHMQDGIQGDQQQKSGGKVQHGVTNSIGNATGAPTAGATTTTTTTTTTATTAAAAVPSPMWAQRVRSSFDALVRASPLPRAVIGRMTPALGMQHQQRAAVTPGGAGNGAPTRELLVASPSGRFALDDDARNAQNTQNVETIRGGGGGGREDMVSPSGIGSLASPHRPPVKIELSNWSLKKVKLQSEDEEKRRQGALPIAVRGKRRNTGGGTGGDVMWTSAPIEKRIGSRLVVDIEGRRIELVGDMDTRSTTAEGISVMATRAFSTAGFPKIWESLLGNKLSLAEPTKAAAPKRPESIPNPFANKTGLGRELQMPVPPLPPPSVRPQLSSPSTPLDKLKDRETVGGSGRASAHASESPMPMPPPGWHDGQDVPIDDGGGESCCGEMSNDSDAPLMREGGQNTGVLRASASERGISMRGELNHVRESKTTEKKNRKRRSSESRRSSDATTPVVVGAAASGQRRSAKRLGKSASQEIQRLNTTVAFFRGDDAPDTVANDNDDMGNRRTSGSGSGSEAGEEHQGRVLKSGRRVRKPVGFWMVDPSSASSAQELPKPTKKKPKLKEEAKKQQQKQKKEETAPYDSAALAEPSPLSPSRQRSSVPAITKSRRTTDPVPSRKVSAKTKAKKKLAVKTVPMKHKAAPPLPRAQQKKIAAAKSAVRSTATAKEGKKNKKTTAIVKEKKVKKKTASIVGAVMTTVETLKYSHVLGPMENDSPSRDPNLRSSARKRKPVERYGELIDHSPSSLKTSQISSSPSAIFAAATAAASPRAELKRIEKRKSTDADQPGGSGSSWTVEQVRALSMAVASVDPTAKNQWVQIAKLVPGKTAGECHDRFWAGHPTPKEPVGRTKSRRAECAEGSPVAAMNTLEAAAVRSTAPQDTRRKTAAARTAALRKDARDSRWKMRAAELGVGTADDPFAFDLHPEADSDDDFVANPLEDAQQDLMRKMKKQKTFDAYIEPTLKRRLKGVATMKRPDEAAEKKLGQSQANASATLRDAKRLAAASTVAGTSLDDFIVEDSDPAIQNDDDGDDDIEETDVYF